jgi:hypothetical protein
MSTLYVDKNKLCPFIAAGFTCHYSKIIINNGHGSSDYVNEKNKIIHVSNYQLLDVA